MKFWLVLGVLFVLTFVGALGAVLYATGNLTGEALARLAGRAPAPEAETVPESFDDLDRYSRELKQRERDLEAREAEVAAQGQRANMTQADLQQLLDQLNQTVALLDQSTRTQRETEEQREARLSAVAEQIVAGMDTKKAAELLSSWEPDRAAEVLMRVPEKTRTKILNEMETKGVQPIVDHLLQSESPILPEPAPKTP